MMLVISDCTRTGHIHIIENHAGTPSLYMGKPSEPAGHSDLGYVADLPFPKENQARETP